MTAYTSHGSEDVQSRIPDGKQEYIFENLTDNDHHRTTNNAGKGVSVTSIEDTSLISC
jgi:hypothetical protein